MLFVKRKDEIVQKLAAGHRRIISENGIDEPRPVFELAVIPNYKANTDRLIKNAAAQSHNAVDKLNSLADLRRFRLA